MWSNMVIVMSPLVNFAASLIKASEPMSVEAFVSDFAVQICHKSILSRLARLDKPKAYP